MLGGPSSSTYCVTKLRRQIAFSPRGYLGSSAAPSTCDRSPPFPWPGSVDAQTFKATVHNSRVT